MFFYNLEPKQSKYSLSPGAQVHYKKHSFHLGTHQKKCRSIKLIFSVPYCMTTSISVCTQEEQKCCSDIKDGDNKAATVGKYPKYNLFYVICMITSLLLWFALMTLCLLLLFNTQSITVASLLSVVISVKCQL